MCGISGILNMNKKKITLKKKIKTMNKILKHRGPDGNGIWINKKSYIGFGHTRLSIIDLDKRASQPMISGDIVVTFNGEIYNYDDLKSKLINWKFKSTSDTEVILAAYAEYGIECIHLLEGMFSIAIWDNKKKILYCVRDRLGIKPFYYTIKKNTFYFASEVKALLPFLDKIEEDIEGISEYLIFQYPITDRCMFKNIKQLMPSTFLTIKSGKLTIEKYWNLDYKTKKNYSLNTHKRKLKVLFEESIKKHIKSDVPISSYVSGGIDSGIITVLANNSKKLLSTYHGKFTEYEGFDESNFAKIICNKNKLELQTLDISYKDFFENIKKIIYHLDYPIVGPGSFPQYMVSKLVSKDAKVVLGGQGGDEIYCGYVRYLLPYLEKELHNSINGNFKDLKSFLSRMQVLKQYIPMLKNFWKEGLFEKLNDRYFSLIDRSDSLKDIINWDIIDKKKIKEIFYRQFDNDYIPTSDFFNKMMDFDLKYSLPALLHVEDRVSMAWGVESRVPILDHNIIEYTASIPESKKIKQGNLKYLLKEVFSDILPNEILDRKDKMGFPVPLNNWFNGKLKEFILGLVISLKNRNLTYLHLTNEFIIQLETTRKFSRKIWVLISLELWYQNYFD